MHSWSPPQSGPFVGRKQDIDELVSLVRDRRLVTLVGMGGIGKSRLAARVAVEVEGAPFTAGHWAPLWSLTNATLLTPLVADACGLSDHSPNDPVDALAARIGTRRVLLVLDSCEHLVGACAALVGALLARCPALVVLATSREPLGTDGETVFHVGPLSLDTEALELFSARAAATGVRLTSPEERVAAAEVCHWLEGVPLALELAAAQLPERPAPAMARLLRGRLALAEGPDSRVLPVRHRALRTTIGWSHELCEPHERLLWARLSVFRSGATVSDVKWVCRGGPLTDARLEAAMEGLIRKSVLTRSGDRLHVFDAVREYGALWLAELGETRATADRHARHFQRLALAAEHAWWGPQQSSSYATLAACYGDLCDALEHLLATNPVGAAELAGSIGFFWACSGHLHEAAHYLEECIQTPVTDPGVLARLCWALGVVRCLRGEYEAAERLADRTQEEAVREADGTLLADAAYLRGLVMLMRGEPLGALAVSDLALAGPGIGAPATARCRLVRVFALTASGDLGTARAEAEALRADAVSVGEHWTRSYTEYQLAVIALLEQRSADAAGHARAMLRDKRLIGDAFGLGLGLDLLAAALTALDRAEESAAASGTGQVFWELVGHPQRGTPELEPMRRHAEQTARRRIGDTAYDNTYFLATLSDPYTTLETILTTN
ncbi:NB-ARC domain-containing protein [Streptomyces sp. NPDC094049]|uniref:ATP-binding protein n=1 Tax=Streptomyces sp. NPDC094049 TaxID=3154987 RepID=UPI00332B3601